MLAIDACLRRLAVFLFVLELCIASEVLSRTSTYQRAEKAHTPSVTRDMSGGLDDTHPARWERRILRSNTFMSQSNDYSQVDYFVPQNQESQAVPPPAASSPRLRPKPQFAAFWGRGSANNLAIRGSAFVPSIDPSCWEQRPLSDRKTNWLESDSLLQSTEE